jgi:hypothetical protein
MKMIGFGTFQKHGSANGSDDITLFQDLPFFHLDFAKGRIAGDFSIGMADNHCVAG